MAIGQTVERPADDAWRELVLDLLPPQGDWSEDAYLWLTERTNRLVELTDGRLEVLPVPTDRHQTVLQFLFLAFLRHLTPLGGKVQFAPLRLRIREGKVREPDLLLVRDAGDPRRQDRFWTGADLVLEVVSPDHPDRDRVQKPLDYAEAGVPEYWIIDPEAETITVLTLEGEAYRQAGAFGRGANAPSVLLPGFAIPVDAVFDAK